VGLDGTLRWRAKAGEPLVLPDGALLVGGDGDRLRQRALDPATGKVLWSEEPSIEALTLVERDRCIGFRYDIQRGRTVLAVATLPPSSTISWEREFVHADPPGLAFDPHVAVDGECVFVVETPGRHERVLALSLDDGTQRWALELGRHRLRPNPDWNAEVRRDLLLFRTEAGVTAVSVRGGTPTWSVNIPGKVAFGRDRVAVVGPYEVTILDMAGRTLVEADFRETLAARHCVNRFTSRPVLSDTHVFVGDLLGTLWALDVNTCEPVWDDRPEGTVGNLRSLTAINGRLYVGDYTDEPRTAMHLYCWEPVGALEAASRKAPLPEFETEGEIPFAIAEVTKRRQLTSQAPYHRGGGSWTVYHCRLQDAESDFWFADRVSRSPAPIRGAEAALWVRGAAEGEALLRAFRKAMPSRKAKSGRHAQRVNPPTHLAAFDLGSQANRQRRKWIAQAGSAELFVEWDLETMRGRLVEKDPAQRAQVLALITGLATRSDRERA
jgi:outer membrane protein assembly factor BamB